MKLWLWKERTTNYLLAIGPLKKLLECFQIWMQTGSESLDEEKNMPTPLPSLIKKMLGWTTEEDPEFDKPNAGDLDEENITGLTVDDLFPDTISDANNNVDSISRFLEVDKRSSWSHHWLWDWVLSKWRRLSCKHSMCKVLHWKTFINRSLVMHWIQYSPMIVSFWNQGTSQVASSSLRALFALLSLRWQDFRIHNRT